MTIDKSIRPFSTQRDRDFASQKIEGFIAQVEAARLMVANDPHTLTDPKLSDIAKCFEDAAQRLTDATRIIRRMR